MSTDSELLSQAANNIASKLGLADGSVSIGTGSVSNDSGAIRINDSESDKLTNIVISASGLGATLDQQAAERKLLYLLDKNHEVRKVLQTVPDEVLAAGAARNLKDATEGTDFDQNILNWSGFNPEIVAKGWSVKDHAIGYIENDAYGIKFGIDVPTDKNSDPVTMAQKIDSNIQERLPEIQKSLAEITAKYLTKNLGRDGKTPEEIAAAVAKSNEDIANLNIAVNVVGGGVEVALRSAKQQEALPGKKDYEIPANADELKASNPLNMLSLAVTEAEKDINPDAAPQLNKALSRAFLYAGGEKAMEVFPLIAGRRDIYSAIAKETQRLPEKAERLKDIMSSDLFKKHGWQSEHGEAGKAPSKPSFHKDPSKPDTLELVITDVDKDKVKSIITALSEPFVDDRAPAIEQSTQSQSPEPAVAQGNIVTNAIQSLINKFSPKPHAEAANSSPYNTAIGQR